MYLSVQSYFYRPAISLTNQSIENVYFVIKLFFFFFYLLFIYRYHGPTHIIRPCLWFSLMFSIVRFTIYPSIYSTKFVPSKLSSTRNNLHWVNQKLKRIARQRDRVFQKHRKSGEPADRKSPSNFLINPTLRIFLMWPQMILPPNPIQ